MQLPTLGGLWAELSQERKLRSDSDRCSPNPEGWLGLLYLWAVGLAFQRYPPINKHEHD